MALLCENAKVLAACAADAIRWLGEQFEYREAADWRRRSVDVVDAAQREPPLALLREAGEASIRVGEVDRARSLFDRALVLVEGYKAATKAIDLSEHGSLLLAQARLLVNTGETDRALPLFEQARGMAQEQGSERDAAVVLGDIARLRAQKGEVEEALRLQSEILEATKRLGDLDGQAATLRSMAQIELSRGDIEKAAPIIAEAYQIFDRIQRLDFICVIGEILGPLLIAAGQRETGLAVLRRSEEGFRKMRRYAEADQVAAIIQSIENG